ncbi:MAG: hypothetical protein SCH68_12780 [Brevefilum sp.]|nr:hypothetical protein [Brevefilum sp.]
MKKIVVIVLFVGMVLLALSSPVFAGGDQNVGETGEGATNQIGCSSQPCASDAPQPQNQNNGDYVLKKP